MFRRLLELAYLKMGRACAFSFQQIILKPKSVGLSIA